MQKNYELICFDLDGTLIQEENGDILWRRMQKWMNNSYEIADKRYDLYLKGKLKIKDWANLDLSEWKEHSVTKDILIEQASHSKLHFGAKETLNILKKHGYKLAIISGSVNILLDVVFPDHPFDKVIINELVFDNDGFLKNWHITDFSHHRKGEALKKIAEKEKIPISKTVYVGDHINDISAAKAAGFSIAFNSKSEELNDVCDIVIEKIDIKEILRHIDNNLYEKLIIEQ